MRRENETRRRKKVENLKCALQEKKFTNKKSAKDEEDTAKKKEFSQKEVCSGSNC